MGFAVNKICVSEVCLFVLGVFILPEVICEALKCNQNDLRALQGFLATLETGIKGWEVTNSSSSNCCSWDGVICMNSTDDDSGRVVKLEVGAKRLVGTLSDSLGNLDHLTTLNLSRNFLKGSIPIKLLHLPNLEVLDLSSNGFSGLFPMSMNLPLIRVFDISYNNFQGPVPVGVCNNSTRIQALKLGANSFAGNLTTGLGNCTFLVGLSLASNFLYGGIPDDLFRLERLELLDLQDNRFSGQLSGTSFGNLSNLVHLDISFNELSGVIPDVFLPLKKLNYFSAQSNKFTGGIPRSLANSPTICSLSLRNNSLSGSIDLNCTATTSLVFLDLATNGFHGPLPANLPACPQLKALNLAKNSFNGGIPESYSSFKSLTQLSLSNASLLNLSSALTTLQHIPNLTTLVLTLNFPDEQLPPDPSIQFTNLKALVIANCGLTGTIPRWLINSPGLQLLDLSWNHLQGTLPPWFSGFRLLFYLDLSNNSFSGEIPKEITQLRSLVLGNVSMDDPSPDIPFFVKRNVSAGGLQYNQIFSFPSTLRLGNNFLTGPIWPEFGNLKKLHVLDLKCNNLSGSIPSSLSGMTSLETLDLSHNNLSGIVPLSLVNLSFLSKFSVAYNMLSGMIPAGEQFATFPNSSFEHNLDLCGNHGYPPCQNINNQTPALLGKSEKAPKSTIIGTALGIGLGTVILLALVYLIVLRITRRKPVDPEIEEDGLHKEFEDLVIIFENDGGNSREITLDDLVKSTNYFDQSNIIGCGGFGFVYKAILCDGRKVAIKRLSSDGGEMEREFQAEVETLSRAKHPNLVHLEGYCRYKNDRLLIYSFMENGSLDYWLHEKPDGPSSLNWETRLVVAQGAARGLAYLHQSCDPHILHRDIKSSNILLDENFEAHLADFGFARLIFPYDTHVTTDLVGTLGYIPPEYGQASIATFKGDIYSFGVVLLELLTGRRPMEVSKPKGSRELISWVMQMKRDNRENEIFEPLIYDKNHAQEMLWVLEIACLCLSESPKSRPYTQQLVSLLDKTRSCDLPQI